MAQWQNVTDTLRIFCRSSVAIGILLLGSLGFGCEAESELRTLEEMPGPVMWWQQAQPHCINLVAVDGDLALWRADICENQDYKGLKKISSVSPTNHDALTAIFQDLPPPPNVVFCGSPHDLFGVRERDSTKIWDVCATMRDTANYTHLDEPYRKLALMFRSFIDRK
jgi:hypothetical protein